MIEITDFDGLAVGAMKEDIETGAASVGTRALGLEALRLRHRRRVEERDAARDWVAA